jgi:hypothetical protein
VLGSLQMQFLGIQFLGTGLGVRSEV